MILDRRDYNCYTDVFGNVDCSGNSAWDRWIRWALLGGAVIGTALLFFLCSCWTARRRRKSGLRPYYGTGWLANNPQAAAAYNSQYGTAAAAAPPYAAPPYSAPPAGQYQSDASTVAPQQTGFTQYSAPPVAGPTAPTGASYEMQTPSHAYQPPPRVGDPLYPPPQGPPPAKN